MPWSVCCAYQRSRTKPFLLLLAIAVLEVRSSGIRWLGPGKSLLQTLVSRQQVLIVRQGRPSRWANALRWHWSMPPPADVWPWPRRSPISPAQGSANFQMSTCARTGWRQQERQARTRIFFKPCRPLRLICARRSVSRFRWARIPCPCPAAGPKMEMISAFPLRCR